MREYNFALLIVALICNTIISGLAMGVGLIETLDTFLLIWLVPTVVFTIWASALYHKSS